MTKRILHLTLKKEYFDLIFVKKTKKEEYRIVKPYWTRRLESPCGFFVDFDEIHFRNGYKKDSPFGIIKHKGTYITSYCGEQSYALKLGRILEVKNLKGVQPKK